MDTDWTLGSPLMIANIDKKEVAVQFEKRNGQLLHLRHYGNKASLVTVQAAVAKLITCVHFTSTQSWCWIHYKLN